MKTRIYIDSYKWEFANGKKPRGFGYWAFEVTNYTTGDKSIVWKRGTFTEAKAQLRKDLKAGGGEFVVYVLP